MNDIDLHRPLIGREHGRQALNTPCLLIDIDTLDRNIARMAAFAQGAGVALRPHAKTHKCVEIARRQIAAGAIGICCAKIGEAEIFAEGGVNDIHITSPVVSAPAMGRLIALLGRGCDVSVVVDHPDNVEALAQAAAAAKVTLPIFIDIDPGIGRTGVASPAAAVEIIDHVRRRPSLAYRGVQYYCAVQQHIVGYDERTAQVKRRTQYLLTVIAALIDAGAPPKIVTGGGTGTHEIDARLGVINESQVGSYIFMDRQYLACDIGGLDGVAYEASLFVDARVVSANAAATVTVDGGLKAFSTEDGPPTVVGGAPEGSCYAFMGDEHGAIRVPIGQERPALGAVVTLLPPHCDPTINLYDTYHMLRGDTLVDLWPVAARGRSR